MAVSSWCRAVGWRLSCYGRQVFSTRVGSHMDALLTNSSQIFLFEKCARTNLSRLRSNPYGPRLWHLRASPARTGFVPSQTQTLCSYKFSHGVLSSTCAKIDTFAQTREPNFVLVRRRARRTFAHTN